MEFSTGSAIRFGWETFKKRAWFFVGAGIVIALIYLVAGGITTAINAALTGSPKEHSLVGSLVSWALSTLISMGVTAFYLNAHDSPETASLAALWHPKPFWKFLAATFLLGLVIFIGIVLLIVPGIIFGLMFMFTTFVVIDRELGPIEAMKESKRITRGHKWTLLGFVLLLILINIAGLLALVVGLLVSIPVSSLATVHAYRTLGGRAMPDAAMATRAS